MKLVMSADEFTELLKGIKIPGLTGRPIASIDIPPRYSARSDITIEFEDLPIALPEPAPRPIAVPVADEDPF